METVINHFSTRGFRPLYVDTNGVLWASFKNKLMVSENNGKDFKNVAYFNQTKTDKISCSSQLISRLCRYGFHIVIPNDDGSIVAVVNKRILRCKAGETQFKTVFHISRGNRPLTLCRIPSGELYFGEYFSNPKRESVNIYGSYDKGNTWNVVYSFPEGVIRHIHGIFYDEYRNGCWILSGDRDDECKILFTSNKFKTLETFISGSQRSRAVSLIPMKNGIIIPTDSPVTQNLIQWFDPNTCEIECRYKLPGSVYYTGKVGKYLIVSTAVEKSKVNSCQYAYLFISHDGGINWSELYSQKKDIWSMKYFLDGTFVLPAGKNSKSIIYAYGQALHSIDNCMLVWEL